MANGEQTLLESWKEISAYLRRSVRTCRRWEDTLELPIHRLDGTPNARVFAYPHELDRWRGEKLHHIEADERAKRLPAFLKKRKPFLIAGAIVAIGLALGGVAVFVAPLLRPVPPAVPDEIPLLAVLPFETPAGDRALEGWRIALPDLLITDLRQSRYLDVVPVRNLHALFRSMKRVEALRLSEEDVAAIAKRFEQDFTATGRLEKTADGIAVEITLRSAKAAEKPPQVVRVTARNEQAILDQADALSREIKSAVGLTRSQIAADVDLPLRRIATPSAEAMKLYSQANWPQDWGIPEMGPPLEKALAIDPNFGLARKLVYEAYDISRAEDIVQSYEKALSLAARMSEREFLLLQVRFYRFCCYQDGLAKLSGAGIPDETIERLKPKTRGEALPVLERLAAFYPGSRGVQSEFISLVDVYMETDEWDKAIATLEIVAPLTLKRVPSLAQILIRCYLARGQVDKAEAVLATIDQTAPPATVSTCRKEIALKKRQFGEALECIERSEGDPGPIGRPYGYHSARGYVLWLADDLNGAEKAFRAVIPEAGPEVEAQRAIDLVALSLSQGKIGQALAEAAKGLEIAEKDLTLSARGMARDFHYVKAYLYRLSGRLPEAMKESEEACRGSLSSGLFPGPAVKLLGLRGIILLESGRAVEFERLLEEIKAICAKEACPKLMRTYHHLRGLQEYKWNRARRAVSELQTAVDMSWPPTRQSDPSLVLYALAEAQEALGNRPGAVRGYEEIAALSERESFAGDIYALSFYRAAKHDDDYWTKGMFRGGDSIRVRVVEQYKKFLGLFGDADPLFAAQIQDARKRLAALGSD
jgi:tetratricopeptide (TPR) repeat protein/TolB-like protein